MTNPQTVAVHSIPHSGTHFAVTCVEAITGVRPRHDHVCRTPFNMLDSFLKNDVRLVVPMRHPYRVLMSNYSREDTLRHSHLSAYIYLVHQYYCQLEVAIMYANAIGLPVFLLPVDRQDQDRGMLLGQLAVFVSGGIPARETELSEQASAAVMNLAVEWPIKGWSEWLDVPDWPAGVLDIIDHWVSWAEYPSGDNIGDFKQIMGAPENRAYRHFARSPANKAVMTKLKIKGTARVIKRDDPDHPANKAKAAER